VPRSRVSYGTVDTPGGLSMTTTCASSWAMRTSVRGSRGRGAAMRTSIRWPAARRWPAPAARRPSTNTLPVSISRRASAHELPSAPRR